MRVRVSAEGCADSEEQLVALPLEELLSFTLVASVELVVAVLDPRGIQRQPAEVHLTQRLGRREERVQEETDETGTVTFSELRPGEVVVSARGQATLRVNRARSTSWRGRSCALSSSCARPARSRARCAAPTGAPSPMRA